MKKVQMAGGAVLLLACILMGKPVVAGQSPAPQSPISCLEAAGQVPTQPTWQPTDVCNMTLCMDDDYCRSVCSSATTATCINNVCYFTFPGGGSSGGGNACPNQRLCRDDSYCIWDNGIDPPIYGSCVNDICVC